MNQPGLAAAPAHSKNDRSIGAILVDAGRLAPTDAERILRYQEEKGLRFGEAGLKLKLLDKSDIDYAISNQFDYPYLQLDDDSLNSTLSAAYMPFTPFVERMRALRSQLLLRWLNGEATQKCIAVTSAGRREGRSFVAANLAIVFSQLGERTLLIDADLRQPCQHRLFKLGEAAGLSGILAGRSGNEVVQRVPGLRGLSVLPAGTVPPNPQELLSRPQFVQLLTRAASAFDVVIIDTSAADSGADSELVAARARAALLVARKDHTSVGTARALTEAVGQSGARVLGAVFNEY
ncbi:chain length determinant protein tyrosine kinase EpsG [Uliginosibacterium sp. H1]|uniref:chain length determinant protein tyrosine kinase EpsG n=1 Tax=Uliginosibacterium sp. H1 TaxID=3114757 RepID=UPI002E1934DA|nr:chain length determinant protein tyrosine kinase EpsG [Uliginosibacterium sp. H1]